MRMNQKLVTQKKNPIAQETGNFNLSMVGQLQQ